MSEVKLKDGTGGKFLAGVDNENRLLTNAVNTTENHHNNALSAESYLYYSDVTPAGAGNTFCYIKNTSDEDLVINWYRVWSGASAEAIDIYINCTGTPGGTTTITPNNMNITSANAPEGLFYEGTNITGLSGGKLLDRIRLSGDGKDVLDSYPGDIIVQKGGIVALQAVNGSIALEITLSFYYKQN